MINPNQSISLNHDSNIKYLNSWSNPLISYENYVNHQPNDLLSVFNMNKLDEFIKVSNASKSCESSLTRFIQSIEGRHLEYWSIASELMLININSN